jgi:osmotically inducible protein OsmC
MMAATRSAAGEWHGSLTEGSGQVTLESSGLGTFDVTWASRTEEPDGRTSPEELVAAAQASCYAMAFSNVLTKAGHPPTTLNTRAEVDFQPGEGITAIRLWVSGDVPGLDTEGFRKAAETAKIECPVSGALAAVPIALTVD